MRGHGVTGEMDGRTMAMSNGGEGKWRTDGKRRERHRHRIDLGTFVAQGGTFDGDTSIKLDS